MPDFSYGSTGNLRLIPSNCPNSRQSQLIGCILNGSPPDCLAASTGLLEESFWTGGVGSTQPAAKVQQNAPSNRQLKILRITFLLLVNSLAKWLVSSITKTVRATHQTHYALTLLRKAGVPRFSSGKDRLSFCPIFRELASLPSGPTSSECKQKPSFDRKFSGNSWRSLERQSAPALTAMANSRMNSILAIEKTKKPLGGEPQSG
ncbi:MAG: hypothetical protein ACK57U_13135 [Planctomycetota bacterium]